MSARNTDSTQPLISLMEEGTHVLRRSPASAWLTYYVTSIPFALFLFFFLNDMARSSNAASHVLESSLILGLLYGVMKVGQGLYCDQLMALVQGRTTSDKIPFRGWVRLVASQFFIHATAPWVLLISLVAMIPLVWTYPFYHNVTVLAVDHFRRGGKTRTLMQIAAAQAHYKWLQNASAMGVLHVIALLVYLNVFAGFVMGANLLKSFSGMENSFTQHWTLLFSSTLQGFLMVACYLVINPLVKSFYVLRCFYGESRTSGADLAVRLRWVLTSRAAVLVAVMWLVMGASGMPAQSAVAEPPPAPAPSAGEVARDAQLAQNIEEVLQRTEYQWRMPREGGGVAKAEESSSWLVSAFKDLGAWINGIMEYIGNGVGDFIDWIFGSRNSSTLPSLEPPGSAWMAMMPKLLMVLGVLLVFALAWLLYRNWRQARKTAVAEVDVAPPEINLESEQVVASQLPENEWLRLAREKMDAGELRLALRALFLATLAHLGEKRLLHITRTKSNGDYLREIARKARGHEELNASFIRQVRTFDRVWYGWHDVSEELMTHFQAEHERITHHAT